MSLSALTVWEIATTGSDSNGGGFVAGSTGTDKSYTGGGVSTATTRTDIATGVVATNVTSSATPFDATDVGNLLQITSGAGWTTGFYQILSVTSGTAALDRAPAAVSTINGSGAVGGALLTPTKAATNAAPNNAFHIKSGTYSNGSVPLMTLPAGSVAPTTAIPWGFVSGYHTTRGDITYGPLGTGAGQNGGSDFRPIFQVTSATPATILVGKGQVIVENLIFDLNGFAVNGFSAAGVPDNLVRGCLFKNISASGADGIFNSGNNTIVEFCEFVGSGLGVGVSVDNFTTMTACHIHGLSQGIFASGGTLTMTKSLIENCINDGIKTNQLAGWFLENNSIVGNGGNGIENTAATSYFPIHLKDNIIADNGGWGVIPSTSTLPDGPAFDGNTYFGNFSGNVKNVVSGALTSDPYAHTYDQLATIDVVVSHAPGGNFGPSLALPGPRGTTWLSQWPGNTATTNYADMGAVQHQDGSGGGGPTAAAIATAIMTDLLASSDFSTANSFGAGVKAALTGLPTVAPGTVGGLPTVDASNNVHGLQTAPPLGATAPANWINTAAFATGATLPVVTLCTTLTTYTGNTPQTGDSFARLGAPAGASVSADIATRSTYAGADTSGTTILLARVPTFPANFGTLSIDATTGGVIVKTNNDKSGYALTTAPPTLAAITSAILVTPGQPIKTDISGNVSVTGLGGNVTVGGYATGQDPATLVLDAPQAAHKNTGTIGENIRYAAASTVGLTAGNNTGTVEIFPPEAGDATGTAMVEFTIDANGNRASRILNS